MNVLNWHESSETPAKRKYDNYVWGGSKERKKGGESLLRRGLQGAGGVVRELDEAKEKSRSQPERNRTMRASVWVGLKTTDKKNGIKRRREGHICFSNETEKTAMHVKKIH